jgi:hypothetical protein
MSWQHFWQQSADLADSGRRSGTMLRTPARASKRSRPAWPPGRRQSRDATERGSSRRGFFFAIALTRLSVSRLPYERKFDQRLGGVCTGLREIQDSQSDGIAFTRAWAQPQSCADSNQRRMHGVDQLTPKGHFLRRHRSSPWVDCRMRIQHENHMATTVVVYRTANSIHRKSPAGRDHERRSSGEETPAPITNDNRAIDVPSTPRWRRGARAGRANKAPAPECDFQNRGVRTTGGEGWPFRPVMMLPAVAP